MNLADLQHPTDKIVFDTLVSLVRKVPWGPSREMLEREAGRMRAQADGHSSRETADELRWQAELFLLASQTRFPREGDAVLSSFTEALVEDVRTFQEHGLTWDPPSMRDVSEAVSGSVAAHGVALADLSLPPTVYELIDQGRDRPHYVDEDRWDRAVQSYYHRMTLDNTPDEFIYGDRDDFYDHDYDDDASSFHDYDDEDESEVLSGQELHEAPAL